TGGSATGGSSGGAGLLPYEPCELSARTGTFTVELGDGFTAVMGSVRNAVTPSDVPELVEEAGSCTLFRARNLFCDPPCASGTTCGESLSCVASPSNQSVGTVGVTGLAVPLEMMPSAVNTYTNPARPELPHPGFSEGATIVLSASGAAGYSPFELEGRGIAALALDDAPLSVVRGQPLALRWTPPAQQYGQVVHLEFQFNRHGGTPTWLECDAPDTGSFDVPASLLDALLDLEVSGWPTLTAARRTVDSTDVASGCVELRVISAVTLDVSLPGITSCDSENPCPPPQECQANLLCE
ncbi:MAG TPA: hypothetical protein VFZ53_15370, partial [Polyangiaceae bacterium]